MPTPPASPLLVEPHVGAPLLAVGAANRAIAARQVWPAASAVDLTLAPVLGPDRQPAVGLDVRVSAFTPDGTAVASLQDVRLPDLPLAAGAYRVRVGPDALGPGAYTLRCIIGAGTATQQTLYTDVVVVEARGVVGLAAPVVATTLPRSGPAWWRALAGLPPASA